MKEKNVGMAFILSSLLLLYLILTWFANSISFLLAVIIYIVIIFLASASVKKEFRSKFIRIASLFFLIYSIYTVVTQFVFVDNPLHDYFLASDQLRFFSNVVSHTNLTFDKIWIKSFSSKLEYAGSGYPLFTAYTSSLQKLVDLPNAFGLLFQKLNVAFLGSFVPGIVYLLCNKVTNDKNAFRASIIYGLLSFNFIYSVLFLRDVHIALIYSIALYLIVEANPKVINFFLLIILGLFAYYIRFENGLFFILFIGIWAYKSGYQNKFVFGIGITAVIAILWAIGGIDFIYVSAFQRTQTLNAHTINKASQGSLYVQMMKLPIPINYLGVTAFGQLKPFPFWNVFQNLAFFKGIFYFPLTVAGLFWFNIWMRLLRHPQKLLTFFRKYKYETLAVILYLIMVSIARTDSRRLMAIYPIIYMAYFYISDDLFKVKELLINTCVYTFLVLIFLVVS